MKPTRFLRYAMVVLSLLLLSVVACGGGSSTPQEVPTPTTASAAPTIIDIPTANVPSAPTPGPTAAPGQPLTEADSGRTVNLAVGETIQVVLPISATSSFTWELDGSLPEAVVKLTSSDVLSGGAGSAPGSAKQVFTFTAAGAGQGVVGFRFVRSGNPTPARTFQVTVAVK